MARQREPSFLAAHLQDSLHVLDSAMEEAAKQVATVHGLFSEVLAALAEMEALDDAISRSCPTARAQSGTNPDARAQLAGAVRQTHMQEPRPSPAPAVASSENELPRVLRIHAASNHGRLDPRLVEEALTGCYGVVDVQLEEYHSRSAILSVRLDSAKEPQAAKSLLRLAMDRLVANGRLSEVQVESGGGEEKSAAA